MTDISRWQGFDIIGDVHGCARTLALLLEQMGYARIGGVWRHPQRQALFLGDIIDRGPRIREALWLVRDMVEAGAGLCIMGNHEFNALGWFTPAPEGSGRTHVREHTPRHQRQIQATLEQFEGYARELDEFVDWFWSLPLYLDAGPFRLVHACWDDQLIQPFAEQRPDATVDAGFLQASVERGSFADQLFDRLLRGISMHLPDGLTMQGSDGVIRGMFRTKFWEPAAQTYGDLVFQPDALPEQVASRPLSYRQKRETLVYGADAPLLFVGHYWQQGRPQALRPNLACLDYSAVKYGRLVSYRWSGEDRVMPENFVWVDVI